MANENTVKAREVRDRNEAEIESLLAAKVEELHSAKFQHALGQLRETHTLKALKRDIAKLRTVLAEKRAAGAAS